MADDESRELNSDVLKEIQEYGISLDADLIYLEGGDDVEDRSEVTWSMARKFRKNLRMLVLELSLSETPDAPITVDIDTPGGDEQAGMSIYDAVRACKRGIVGHVTGQASSMGCVILQAFKDRALDPSATVMYHSGDACVAAPGQEFASAAAFSAFYSKKLDDVVYARVLEKQPLLTRDQFDLIVMRGLHLDAQQAVDFGLADRIMNP